MVEASLMGVIAAMIVLIVLLSLQFSRTLQKVLNHADSVHERSQAAQSDLLDRLMATDFTLYKAYKSAEDAPEGGWEESEKADQVAERPWTALDDEERDRMSLGGTNLTNVEAGEERR